MINSAVANGSLEIISTHSFAEIIHNPQTGQKSLHAMIPFRKDDNIDYYYDFSQSIAEYSKVFTELNVNWLWQPVNMSTFREVIETIEAEKETRKTRSRGIKPL
jgi:hypothetical protein